MCLFCTFTFSFCTIQTHKSMKEGLDPACATDEFHTCRKNTQFNIYSYDWIKKEERFLKIYMKGQCYVSNLIWHGAKHGGFNKNWKDYYFLIIVDWSRLFWLRCPLVIRPGGQSDQISTSEFSFSSVWGRVSRSSPPFQTKCHAQELAT